MRISDWSSDVCSSDLRGILALDRLDAGDEERIALEEFPDPESRLPLTDEVMGAVFAGDVAQDSRSGADGMEIVGARRLGLRIALEQDAEGPLAPRDRTSAASGKSVSGRVEPGC